MMPLFIKKAKSLMKGDREGASGAFQTPTVEEVGRKPSLCLVDKPDLSERENLTSGRALRYIWGPNNDHYAVSAQEVAQNNSPAKSHILLASWPFLASSAHGLPCSASLSSSHSICQGMAATGHMEVSSLGVVCDWNGVGLQVVALPLPVLAFGGREGAQKSFPV